MPLRIISPLTFPVARPGKTCSRALVRVFPNPLDRTRGHLRLGVRDYACVLGSGGPVQRKREGDGGTPIARMILLAGRYRNDRLVRPRTRLALTCLKETDGWCDDPGDGRYNQAVRLPVASRHERMMRSDGLYDVVLVLDWNMRPRVRGRGSAIFFHLSRADRRPTEGCIAVDRAVMPRLLARLGPGAVFEVHGVTPRKGMRCR